ncbi:caffeic acid 3-O-methyltransferase-like [Actinidia eriantha]|uniref:caffeic acid 3-O-methyltransferase-like n=1 Tax=Actinidia eriantha TaxID=165200 RepID=UPI002590BC30|nr:caffeic acid 3-O-methyltransferase-like [Actinidia eriantha]
MEREILEYEKRVPVLSSPLLSSSEIASQLHSNNPQAPIVLDRILCLLASHSILNCSNIVTRHNGQHVNRLYGLAPVSKYFIPNQDGVSLAPMLEEIQDKGMVNMWYHLKDAAVEGGLPFNRANGMNAIDYVGKDASWDDEHCLKILPDNGKVIVVAMVVPETPETSNDIKSGVQFDLFLMNMNPGGKERTKSEFESLAKETGFSSIKVAGCSCLQLFTSGVLQKNVTLPKLRPFS